MTHRMTPDEALDLLAHGDTADMMERAHRRRLELHGLKTHFVNSLNLNPTNLCELDCKLCAFFRPEGAADVYRVNLEEARSRFQKAAHAGLTEVHVVGGLHKDFDLEYHESLFRIAKEVLPGVLIQGLTAVEIDYLSRISKLPIETVLARLKDAGLGGIPGGGAELFSGEIRAQICRTKISGKRWLRIHELAHAIGIRTNVTMLFGHIERDEHIVDHMLKVRELQDKTGGFQSFIPLPFHPDGTMIEVTRKIGGHRIARVVALARLFLDNVPHIRVLANYMDIKLIQVLTHAGADDVGGTSFDERIASAAGAPTEHCFQSVEHVRAMLSELGLEPVLTNSQYHKLPQHSLFRAPKAATLPATSVEDALRHAEEGRRVTLAEAVALYDHAPFQKLGAIAHASRMKAVPGNVATFTAHNNNAPETGPSLIEQLINMRERQDKTGDVTAFAPPKAGHGIDYLRAIAISRIVLDNVPHIEANWLTVGGDLAQLALVCGADDVGAVPPGENAIALIHETGMNAAERTAQYHTIRTLPRVSNATLNHVLA